MKSQTSRSGPDSTGLEKTFVRVKCDYRDLSEKFKHKKKDFNRQFSSMYSYRLKKMSALLQNKIRGKWGEEFPLKRLADLEDEFEGKCIVIGTIYKNQELRPSILKEISDELQVVPQQKLVRFVDDKDELILEDELQRIRLFGNIEAHSFVTGVIVALLGYLSNDKFHVDDVCLCGPMLPSGLSIKPSEPERYLVMLSGLDLASASDSLLPLRMFSDWITGWLGDPSDQHKNSKIALVLIAGNLIRGRTETRDGKIIMTSIDNSGDVLSSVKTADDFLAELAETVHVELMPGEFDPTNFLLPQQPLHYKMFPNASSYSSLHGGTNPHSFQVENRLITGSSGQPVADITRYSNIEDPIEALESTLHWGHIAPTSPDSLPCYPYADEDPFILENQPDIYFSGNHNKFQTKIVSFDHGSTSQKTRLVCIPSFNLTRTVVVVNLTTLECEKVSFSVGDLSMDISQ